jgi:hypothetical protein
MERVRRWAEEHAIPIIDEIAFIDTRTDRATADCREALVRARRRCGGTDASLVYVKFHEINLWRYNPHIRSLDVELGFEPIELSPDPITIGADQFDPIRHFNEWRRRDQEGKANLRQWATAGFDAALAQIPEGLGRYKAIADRLNAQGTKTVQGRAWTAENVRKLLKNKPLE